MRVTEQSGWGMAPEFLSRGLIRVAAFAARKEAFLAKETFPAGNRERHDNPITNFKVFTFGANFDDLSHGFVT
jgi:hypothetical protein